MIEFEFDRLAEQRNFWIAVVAFMFISGVFQVLMENYMLATTAFGSATVFAVLAGQQLEAED